MILTIHIKESIRWTMRNCIFVKKNTLQKEIDSLLKKARLEKKENKKLFAKLFAARRVVARECRSVVVRAGLGARRAGGAEGAVGGGGGRAVGRRARRRGG